MKSSKSLDTHYFTKKLNELVRDMGMYTPDEMARALARLARTACPEVLAEQEFAAPGERPATGYRNQNLYQVTGMPPVEPGQHSRAGLPIVLHVPAGSPAEALAAYHQASANLHGNLVSIVQDVSLYGQYDEQGRLTLAPRIAIEDRNMLVDVTARALASHPRAAEFVGQNYHALWQGLLNDVFQDLKINLITTDIIPALQQAHELINTQHERQKLIGKVATEALAHAIDHDYNVEDLDMALTGVYEAAQQMNADLDESELALAAQRLLEGAECLRQERMESLAGPSI
ncbi:hypothetical protein [Geopseudomonas aromaticivorans]